MIGFDSALQGLQNAQAKFEQSAQRIASSALPGSGGDTVSLSDEIVGLLQARNAFSVNARVGHTADELQKNLLDVFG